MATTTITTPGDGSWQAPAGVTSVAVEMWGGGGGGGSLSSAMGGGGGAYAKLNAYTVVPGNSYAYHVGAGGPTDQLGEATWWVSPAVGNADFGVDGADFSLPGQGGLIANCVGDVKRAGGHGAGAVSGGGGSSAGTAANGNNGSGTTGGAAPVGGGAGGDGGVAGHAPGGGGGAGLLDAADGAAGQIVLTYTASITATPKSSGIGIGLRIGI